MEHKRRNKVSKLIDSWAKGGGEFIQTSGCLIVKNGVASGSDETGSDEDSFVDDLTPASRNKRQKDRKFSVSAEVYGVNS